ncbi:hypothetical protein Micbo1qcDRAFT_166122, partial [Microdochium bolleyi]
MSVAPRGAATPLARDHGAAEETPSRQQIGQPGAPLRQLRPARTGSRRRRRGARGRQWRSQARDARERQRVQLRELRQPWRRQDLPRVSAAQLHCPRRRHQRPGRGHHRHGGGRRRVPHVAPDAGSRAASVPLGQGPLLQQQRPGGGRQRSCGRRGHGRGSRHACAPRCKEGTVFGDGIVGEQTRRPRKTVVIKINRV